jgi:hypothetical protein
MPAKRPSPVPALLDPIQRRIFTIRGMRVMLSTDLAQLYEVEVRALMQAVKRNPDRFPEDFMFQLTWDEAVRIVSPLAAARSRSRSQSVILKLPKNKKGANLKYLPYAFTEQGVAMLSGLLRSRRAVAVNVGIMRAFVGLRKMLASNKSLARRLDELEKKYDSQFSTVFEAIRGLMEPPDEPPDPPREPIGFRCLAAPAAQPKHGAKARR